MSLWVFQDISFNNYVAYINPSEIGVIKSATSGTPILWNYTETTSDTKANVVATVDELGIVYVAYQRLSDGKIVVRAISATGTTRLWIKTFLPDPAIGTYTNPSLTVVRGILVLSCVGGSGGLIQVVKMTAATGAIQWNVELGTAGGTASTIMSDGAIQTAYTTGGGSSTQVTLEPSVGSVRWLRTYPEKELSVPCFLQGAPVRMADNTWRRIETLVPGDLIWTDKGPRPVEYITKTPTEPSSDAWPYYVPVGLFGALWGVAISPSHRILTPTGLKRADNISGLRQIPLKKEWVYYNIVLRGWEHICVAGMIVESCAPLKLLTVSRNLLNTMIHTKSLTINAAFVARLLKMSKIYKGGEIMEIPVMENL